MLAFDYCLINHTVKLALNNQFYLSRNIIYSLFIFFILMKYWLFLCSHVTTNSRRPFKIQTNVEVLRGRVNIRKNMVTESSFRNKTIDCNWMTKILQCMKCIHWKLLLCTPITLIKNVWLIVKTWDW